MPAQVVSHEAPAARKRSITCGLLGSILALALRGPEGWAQADTGWRLGPNKLRGRTCVGSARVCGSRQPSTSSHRADCADCELCPSDCHSPSPPRKPRRISTAGGTPAEPCAWSLGSVHKRSSSGSCFGSREEPPRELSGVPARAKLWPRIYGSSRRLPCGARPRPPRLRSWGECLATPALAATTVSPGQSHLSSQGTENLSTHAEQLFSSRAF